MRAQPRHLGSSGRGFDVTAIDIATMAVVRAREKARQAGVSVEWLLADVLAPPPLEPFDFIYDRGCYHEVRHQNLNAYLETLRRMSRSGTRLLLLAGNANELPLDYGPPGVTERQIRRDFGPLFEIEWVRETRFETNHPAIRGSLAWAVLLRRKPTP
jgi:SAM-dependent methyltransferase